ncbi:Arc family DNA-binding protein [Burkholderia ubonensis]|uniref:Arc family DNA-binding protein n=1 Tax=Burkholderia ubonensis TaxID=101571 RepID=UPI0009B3973E|nr:Arc family DNA-binding protein [Burkholderia ubonensis]
MTTKPTRPATAHIPPFGLRMQPELKAKLEESAAKAGRSLNAEIVARLEQSIQNLPGGVAGTSYAPPELLHQMLEVSEETEKLRREVGEVLEIVKNAMTPEEIRRRYGRGPQYDEPANQQTEASKPATKRVTRSKRSQS